MKEFQAKKRSRRWRQSPFLALILFCLIVVLARAVINIYGKNRSAARAYEAARREAEVLVARRAVLEAALGELATDRGVEAVIREKFGLIKTGERVINIVVEEATGSTTTISTGGVWQNFRRWLAGFFN